MSVPLPCQKQPTVTGNREYSEVVPGVVGFEVAVPRLRLAEW